MLRSLMAHKLDPKTGERVVDENGKFIAIDNPQPKDPKLYSAADKYYYEVEAPAREEDLAIVRYQERVAREAILRAAQADLAGK